MFEYLALNSGIFNWNSEFKVILSMIMLIICIACNNMIISFLVLIMAGYISIIAGGVHLLDYIKIMLIPVAFLIIGSIPIALEISKEPLDMVFITFNDIYIGSAYAGLLKTTNLWLKTFGAVSALFMLTLSTPMYEVVSVLRKVKIPNIIIELMRLMYRYIFVLIDTERRMRIAAKSRMGYANYKVALYSFGQIGSNLFLVSLQKASLYYDAMISRGYDGKLEFWEEEKKITVQQVAAGSFVIGYLVLGWLIFG